MTQHRYTRSLTLPIICVLGLLLLGQTSPLGKSQLPTVTVYTDSVQTISSQKTFTAPIKLGSATTPTANGEIGYDGTNLLLREGGSNKTVGGGSSILLYAATANSDTASNTTNEITFNTSVTVAANALAVGDVLDVDVRGVYSTATGSPNVTAKLKFGTTNLASVSVMTQSLQTNQPWGARWLVTVRSTGATGTAAASIHVIWATSSTTTQGYDRLVTVTINTTAAASLGPSITWGTADASNSATVEQVVIRKLR